MKHVAKELKIDRLDFIKCNYIQTEYTKGTQAARVFHDLFSFYISMSLFLNLFLNHLKV